MPLKGVLLQRLVYDDPTDRVITDVDLLVPAHRLAEAREALRAAGFRHRALVRSMIADTLVAPNGMVVDLHGHLFGPGRYEMGTADVFGRATRDEGLFGAPVARMHPLDVYAHLLGKLVSDHADLRQRRRFVELALVSDRLDLAPEATAEHLMRCGMRRAARYALPLVDEVTGNAFAREVLRRLSPDPLGDALAAAARTVIQASPPQSFVGAVPAHLLNHSLPRAGYAMAAAAVNRVRYHVRRLRG